MRDKYDKRSISSVMKAAHIPGGSFANIDAEGTTDTIQIGTTAKDSVVKITKNTPLPCASLSKPVFAYLVLKLIEANKTNSVEPGLGKFNTEFDLDKPILYSRVKMGTQYRMLIIPSLRSSTQTIKKMQKK